MSLKESVATGRRKTAVASVRIREFKDGKIVVNRKKTVGEYFKTDVQLHSIYAPLELVGKKDAYDIIVNVKGGGLDGQATAISLGIARALVLENEEFKQPLRDAGLLTRDPRRRERKKYGRPAARKSFQFSKR